MSKFVQNVRDALLFQMKAGTVERALESAPGASDQNQRFSLSKTRRRM
jgi:hypothetical protein